MIVLHYLEEVSNGEADLDPDEDTIKLSDEDYYSDEDEVEDLEAEVVIQFSKRTPKEKQQKEVCDYFIHEKIHDDNQDSDNNCPIHSYSDNFKCRRYNLSEFPDKEKIKLLSENVLDVSRNFNN